MFRVQINMHGANNTVMYFDTVSESIEFAHWHIKTTALCGWGIFTITDENTQECVYYEEVPVYA